MHPDSSEHCSRRHSDAADSSYIPDVSVGNYWHVSRDAYEAHCSQLDDLDAELEQGAKVTSAMGHDGGTMLCLRSV